MYKSLFIYIILIYSVRYDIMAKITLEVGLSCLHTKY